MSEIVKIEESMVVKKKKRGRKRIKEKVSIKDQRKFFVDYSSDDKRHERVVNILEEANKKEYGREIQFKDLVSLALSKVTSKDIDKLKEESLQEMDKVNILLEKHNEKNGVSLSLGEFLVKQLKLS